MSLTLTKLRVLSKSTMIMTSVLAMLAAILMVCMLCGPWSAWKDNTISEGTTFPNEDSLEGLTSSWLKLNSPSVFFVHGSNGNC